MTAMTIIADTIREECFPRDGADGLGEYCDETAVKIIDALHLAGYGVLGPREIMLNAANAVELRELRIQRQGVRKFLGLPVDGLTYTPSFDATISEDDVEPDGVGLDWL